MTHSTVWNQKLDGEIVFFVQLGHSRKYLVHSPNMKEFSALEGVQGNLMYFNLIN
jgi:hypothetical protein